jgi:hypothetical protein
MKELVLLINNINNNVSTTKFYEINIKTKYTDYNIKQTDNLYILGGWTGQAIVLFFEHVDNSMYRVGIINAGIGVDIHGITDDMCNGILIFDNINYSKITDFLEDYIIFFIYYI